MQKALNSIDGENALVDGVGGSKTIDKINNLPSSNVRDPIKEYTTIKRDSVNAAIKNNPTQKRFEKGWISRLDRVMERALGYANEQPAA